MRVLAALTSKDAVSGTTSNGLLSSTLAFANKNHLYQRRSTKIVFGDRIQEAFVRLLFSYRCDQGLNPFEIADISHVLLLSDGPSRWTRRTRID
jgi:hypothetical protein